MNKSRIYIIVALLIGIGVGYFIFSSTGDDSQKTESNSHADRDGETLSTNEFRLSENEVAHADVQTIVVGKSLSNGKSDINLSGEIVFNRENQNTQVSYFKGRLEKLIADFKGKKVKKGDLIAYIYSPDLIEIQKELKSAAALKKLKPELYAEAYNKLKDRKLSERQIRRIEENNDPIKRFPIYATVSGTIKEVLVSTGDDLEEGQGILELSNLNSVSAKFDISDKQISNFNQGQTLQITTEAYPDQIFDGEISIIDSALDSNKSVNRIRVHLPNLDQKLKPGMFVNASIPRQNTMNENIFYIPSSAVLRSRKTSVVYLKTKKNMPVFEMREVVLGDKEAANYEVLKGLKYGDRIVIEGVSIIDSLVQVQGNE
ncbi:efflux RND transporter periplasmic adaptor subunit [Psychroflexus halocasei]|uniref:Membrane fusion protein, Cu(I)/Ag(I) efflux system n=1 Tax=Psychroflexus halocasei TaxID=908615 RepID=A0A1H3VDV9_9FLAO|nr:efflux RND transporter periplasmic adaptor subunit [Psychroflexus halocasei]SDZ72997.1 membrane fusion protein, Cu(I)/Ag(I) efflux system [Psychroflexus halocasei]